MATPHALEDAIYTASVLGPGRRPGHRALSLFLSGGLYLLVAGAIFWIEARRATEGRQPRVVTVSLDLVEVPLLPPPPPGAAAAPPRAAERPAGPAEAAPPDQAPAEPTPLESLPSPATGTPSRGPAGPDGGAPMGAPGGVPGGALGGEIGNLLPPAFNAAYLNNPAPSYPALSRRLGEEGRVLLKVLVGLDGRPGWVEIHQSSGHPRLDQAALATVARWRFIPARRGAEAMAATVIVPIRFQLDT